MSSLRRIEPTDSPSQLTIEQLAAESGMSVRNIRAHQARGLLAPPEARIRVGYYGPEHLAQLRLIRELQEDGFNLGGIKRLLDDTHGTAERLLRFKPALSATTRGEPVETLSIGELAQRFRVDAQEAPAEHGPDMESLIGKLRPIAAQALLALFKERMSAQVQDAFGEITRRLSAQTP